MPVVGKFVSDSLEVVMGASEIIGKAVGVIGIVVMILMALVPIIKLIIHSLMYFILSAISELLSVDNKITTLCESMSKQYKTMLRDNDRSYGHICNRNWNSNESDGKGSKLVWKNMYQQLYISVFLW